MNRLQERHGIGTKIQNLKIRKMIVIVLFMIVPLTLLIVFTYVPFATMFSYSFYRMKYIGEREWVGLENYISVFTRDDCIDALKNSLYYLGGALVQLAVALYLATILSFKVKGGNVFKGMMFFPYLVNGIALGFIFKFFYSRGFVLDSILQFVGIDLESLPYWIKDQRINNISLAATSVWRYFGQNMVLFIGAIMSVDGDMYEASYLDGASKLQQIIHIILPNIKTIVILNVILSITGALSAFEPAYVITNGGVGTATYFVVMNELAHVSQKVGLASAMAIILLIIIVIVTLFQKVLFKYAFSDLDDATQIQKRRQRSLERYKRRHQNDNR